MGKFLIKTGRLVTKLIPKRVRNFITYETLNNSKELNISIDSILYQHYVHDFINGNYGVQYGITKEQRKELFESILINIEKIPTATNAIIHIFLIREILNIPKETKGDIIECGCYKGGSSASLSLAAKLTARKLIVCDSFEGLPSGERDIKRVYPHLKVYGYYEKGMYEGRLDEVKANIKEFGNIESCEFIKGYFSETLKQLKEPIAFAFLDVDFTSSMYDCIYHIWPLLIEGGYLFTDDSCDISVVKAWFDEKWWQENLGEEAPGYVGSGCGLPISTDFSSLGYIRKIRNIDSDFKQVPWLSY